MKNVEIHLFEWESSRRRLWFGLYLNDPLRKYERHRYLYGYINFLGLNLDIDPILCIDFHRRVYIHLSLIVDLILVGFGISFEWEWSRVSDNNPSKDEEMQE